MAQTKKTKKKSNNYWKNRFLKLEEASNRYGQDAFREIEPAFDSAQRQIQREIEKWYYRFAKNNQISIEEAKKMLSAKELKEFRWDVNEYIKYGRENAINQQWMKELENASARVHVSRLEALKMRTQQAAEVAFGNELDVIDKMARKVYTEDYYRTIFEMQKGFNIGWEIGEIDQNQLDKLISKPWTNDDKTFKDRIWTAKNQMVSELHQQLVRICLLGKAPGEAIEALTKYVDKSIKNRKYAASRLVMTEQSYFHSVAQKKAYTKLDTERVRIVATLDDLTSKICQEMDGKIVDMKDFEPGVTVPPFHVFCRSTTAPLDEDFEEIGERIARDKDGNTYYVPSNMTYKEWKKSMVDGENSLLTNGQNRGIISSGSIASRNMANGMRTTAMHTLTHSEIESLKEDIRIIKADEKVFRFNKGDITCYKDEYDVIFVRGDVLPATDSLHPRDLMSSRAVLAHEYYGHRTHRNTIAKECSWNDEFRASYIAAKITPNLSDEDRRYLILDALERAKEKGVSIKYNDFIRGVLYGN